MDIGVLTEDKVLCRFLCLELCAAGWTAGAVTDFAGQSALYLCDLDAYSGKLPENAIGFSYDGRKSTQAKRFLLRPIDTAELREAVAHCFPDAAPLRHPVLRADAKTRTVHGEGGSVRLSQKEYALLEALADGMLSRDAGGRRFGDGQSNALDVYVHYLRRKLKAVCGGETVLAVRGEGYRLSPDLILRFS